MKLGYRLFYPALFAIYPLLFLYSHNQSEVPMDQIWLPAAVSLGSTLVFFGMWYALLGNAERAAAITTVASIIFFSYGHLFEVLDSSTRGPGGAYLIAIATAAFLVTTWLLARGKKNLAAFSTTLNAMGVVLIAMSLWSIAVFELSAADSENFLTQTIAVGDTREISNERPDIYYIVLDSYPSTHGLKKFYDYDNSKFTGYLRKRGFMIAEKSRSNYAQTLLSLASSLNLDYINDLSERQLPRVQKSMILQDMIGDNQVGRFLRQVGYEFVHVRSSWSGTARNKYADREIFTGNGNEFSMILVRTTALRIFERRIGLVKAGARQRILATFERLQEVPQSRKPTFTFAHIVAPHPPYLFGQNGEKLKETNYKWDGTAWKQQALYLGQLRFINSKMRETIDAIMTDSETEPIVIVQGDHGPASTFYLDPIGTWRFPTNRQLDERTGILSAYYLPGNKVGSLPANISPVNSFRLIFNAYFDTDYDLLPNEVYFSSYQSPYDFATMTGRLTRMERRAGKRNGTR